MSSLILKVQHRRELPSAVRYDGIGYLMESKHLSKKYFCSLRYCVSVLGHYEVRASGIHINYSCY